MVVGLQPRAAEVPKVADPAVPARPGVRLVLARERVEEPRAHPPVVRLELGDAEALPLAAPVLDVDALDRRALQPLDLLGVEEELEQVRRLGRARELRVDGLVGAGRRALEEVGEPAPAPVGADEVRLVDDLGGALADRLLGEASGIVGLEVLVLVAGHAGDRPPERLEPREVGSLVLVALAADQVDVRVVGVRPLELARVTTASVEVRQVRAGEVVREVGRGERDRAVGLETHDRILVDSAEWPYEAAT